MATKKPINIEIGERIRARRERNGLSREYLAEVTGYSVRYLGMVEVGAAGISLEGLRLFSAKLNVSTDYLLNGADDIFYRNINTKLDGLKVINPQHIENVEMLLDTYISGTKL